MPVSVLRQYDKKCTSCGGTKSLNLFSKSNRIKSGYTSTCKSCKNNLNDGYRTPEARQRSNESARRYYLAKRALLRETKAERGCRDCGFTNPVALEFHHIDPSTKHEKLVKGRYGMIRLSLEELVDEIEKCIVLCANCHRIEEDKLKQVSDAS